ncbi:hypothetical protein V8E54_006704 [Elaphomyces granulatus]
MIEPVCLSGLIGALGKAAEQGLKVSGQMKTFVRGYRDFPKEVDGVISEVDATAGILLEIAGALSSKERPSPADDITVKTEFMATIQKTMQGCQEVFDEVWNAVHSMGVPAPAAAEADDLDSSKQEKPKWPLERSKAISLQANLNRLKTGLIVQVNVLMLARQMHEAAIKKQAEAEISKAEKLRIVRLNLKLQEAEHRYRALQIHPEESEPVYANSLDVNASIKQDAQPIPFTIEDSGYDSPSCSQRPPTHFRADGSQSVDHLLHLPPPLMDSNKSPIPVNLSKTPEGFLVNGPQVEPRGDHPVADGYSEGIPQDNSIGLPHAESAYPGRVVASGTTLSTPEAGAGERTANGPNHERPLNHNVFTKAPARTRLWGKLRSSIRRKQIPEEAKEDQIFAGKLPATTLDSKRSSLVQDGRPLRAVFQRSGSESTVDLKHAYKYTNTGTFYTSPGNAASVMLPSLLAWSLRRAEAADGGPPSTWKRAIRVPLPIRYEELERNVRKQQRKGWDTWKVMASLLTYQQQQIDRLVQDKAREDPNLSHYEWTLAALRIDPQKSDPSSALSIQVILQRRPRASVSFSTMPPSLWMPNLDKGESQGDPVHPDPETAIEIDKSFAKTPHEMQNGQAEALPRPRRSTLDSRRRTVLVGDEVGTRSDLDFEIPPSPVRPPSGLPSMIDDEDKFRSRSSAQRLHRFSGESLRRRWIEEGGRPFSLEELRSRDQLEMVYPPQPQSLESTVDHLVERWFSFATPTPVY